MTDDRQLLRQYAECGSDAAFAELVRRHVDLVYSAALRQMNGDAHRAQEVTSMTFASLARKAGSLLRHPVLPAWLYRSTYLAATMLKRTEARRSAHERAAAEESSLLGLAEAAGADWEATRPVLDAAMAELGERDREAIVLRYFANAPFGEVGRRLGLSENAARMRVDRAIEKLRARLASRGVTSTAAALGLVLTEQAVAAAPAGTAAGVMSTALVGVKAGAALSLLQLMSATKIQLAGWAAVLAGGTGFIAAQHRAEARLAAQVAVAGADGSNAAELRGRIANLQVQIHQAVAWQTQLAIGAADQARIAAARTRMAALSQQQMARRAALVPASLGHVYQASELDQVPTAVTQLRPQYPFEMRRAGQGGKVTISFVVAPDGTVVSTSVVDSSSREFEASALAAVSQWKFDPGKLHGSVVPVQMQIPIVFSLGNGSSKASDPGPNDWFASNDTSFVVESSKTR